MTLRLLKNTGIKILEIKNNIKNKMLFVIKVTI